MKRVSWTEHGGGRKRDEREKRNTARGSVSGVLRLLSSLVSHHQNPQACHQTKASHDPCEALEIPELVFFSLQFFQA